MKIGEIGDSGSGKKKVAGEDGSSTGNVEVGVDSGVNLHVLVNVAADDVPKEAQAVAEIQWKMWRNEAIFGEDSIDVVIDREPGVERSGPQKIVPDCNERDFVSMFAEFPSKQEWDEMSKHGAAAVLREAMEVLGQLKTLPFDNFP